jgi:hypothetical protein
MEAADLSAFEAFAGMQKGHEIGHSFLKSIS